MSESHRLPPGQRRECACGCGGLTNARWVRGHDSKALSEALVALGCYDLARGQADVRQFVWAVRDGLITRVDR